jgi:hypothetical protein
MSPRPTAQQLNPQPRKNPGQPRRDAKCQERTKSDDLILRY